MGDTLWARAGPCPRAELCIPEG
ncbi:hypothetical protein Nmel_009940 [Mimus melanotis]